MKRRAPWALKHRPEPQPQRTSWADTAIVLMSLAFWTVTCASAPFTCGAAVGAYERGHQIGAGRCRPHR